MGGNKAVNPRRKAGFCWVCARQEWHTTEEGVMADGWTDGGQGRGI